VPRISWAVAQSQCRLSDDPRVAPRPGADPSGDGGDRLPPTWNASLARSRASKRSIYELAGPPASSCNSRRPRHDRARVTAGLVPRLDRRLCERPAELPRFRQSQSRGGAGIVLARNRKSIGAAGGVIPLRGKLDRCLALLRLNSLMNRPQRYHRRVRRNGIGVARELGTKR